MRLASLHDRIRSWYRRRYQPAALNAWLIKADGVCNGREKMALRPERGVRAGALGNGSERDGAHLTALIMKSLTTACWRSPRASQSIHWLLCFRRLRRASRSTGARHFLFEKLVRTSGTWQD